MMAQRQPCLRISGRNFNEQVKRSFNYCINKKKIFQGGKSAKKEGKDEEKRKGRRKRKKNKHFDDRRIVQNRQMNKLRTTLIPSNQRIILGKWKSKRKKIKKWVAGRNENKNAETPRKKRKKERNERK